MTAWPVADLAGWLGGRWNVRRRINDDPDAFRGTADFRPGPTTLVWHEQGTARLGGHEGPAHRTLHLSRPTTPDGAWQVSFEDGRPFHELDLRTGRWAAEHLCGPDVYRGEYVVAGPDRLAVTWRVTGPRKDDVIATAYERATADERQ